MNRTLAYRWYIKYPQDAYALGPITFADKVPEAIVRKYARELDGIKRLPAGFACWPVL